MASSLATTMPDRDAVEVSVHQLVLSLNVNKHIVYEVLAYLEAKGWARKVRRGTWKIMLWKVRHGVDNLSAARKERIKQVIMEIVAIMRGSCGLDALIDIVKAETKTDPKTINALVNELIESGYLGFDEENKQVYLTGKKYRGGQTYALPR